MNGVIHIVRTHKGRGERSSQMRTIACKRGEGGGFKIAYVQKKKKNFLDHKISKRFVFCTKETMTLPFIIVIEKCKPTLSYN